MPGQQPDCETLGRSSQVVCNQLRILTMTTDMILSRAGPRLIAENPGHTASTA